MIEHPDRRAIVEEMHLRRWPSVVAPCSIVQLLRLVATEDRAMEHGAVSRPPRGSATTVQERHVTGAITAGTNYIWERHSEASSLTIFCERWAVDGLTAAVSWAEDLPGRVVRATRITIAETDAQAEDLLPELAFLDEELVSCDLGESTRFWSDFRIGPDGYGRILIAANGENPRDLGRIVQRLQELGNYRNLALLGLPMARNGWHELDVAEELLASVGLQLTEASVRDDVLFEKLTTLSLRVSAITHEAGYRMSATAAYARLVEERLAELAARPQPGCQSLADFTQRRFLPAIRTCASFDSRSKQLSDATARLVSLLRARIEARIENQNAMLLRSLERSASRQLRLQQLVEGFSVLAISYYTISLFKYLLEGAEDMTGLHHRPIVVALLVPLVVLATWFGLHRLRSSVLAKE